MQSEFYICELTEIPFWICRRIWLLIFVSDTSVSLQTKMPPPCTSAASSRSTLGSPWWLCWSYGNPLKMRRQSMKISVIKILTLDIFHWDLMLICIHREIVKCCHRNTLQYFVLLWSVWCKLKISSVKPLKISNIVSFSTMLGWIGMYMYMAWTQNWIISLDCLVFTLPGSKSVKDLSSFFQYRIHVGLYFMSPWLEENVFYCQIQTDSWVQVQCFFEQCLKPMVF